METRDILGVKVNFGFDFSDVLSLIDSEIESQSNSKVSSKIVCTTNPEFIVAAQEDEEFRKIINRSLVSVPDGSGVLYANTYLKNIEGLRRNFLFPISSLIVGLKAGLTGLFDSRIGDQTRITGVDLIERVCERAAQKGHTVFLFGGWPKDIWGRDKDIDYDLAQKTADVLKNKYPGLKIVGATSRFSSSGKDDEESISYIREKLKENNIDSIDILFAAFSQGAQEKWLNRNLQKLNVKIGIGIGGSFDFITDEKRRAPKIVQNLHLEWVYRLAMQPWRIRRILMAFPTFPIKVYLFSQSN